MKYATLVIFLVFPTGLFAQQLSPDVLSGSGDFSEGDVASLSWTLGELAIETLEGEDNILTQGFQQSSYKVASFENTLSESVYIMVYPNPASDILTLTISLQDRKRIQLDVVDVAGRILLNKKFEASEVRHEIDIRDLISGIYFLRITSGDYSINRTYQIQKIPNR